MSRNKNRNQKPMNMNPLSEVETMPRSEHETAAKDWAIEKQELVKTIEAANAEKTKADQTINNIVQHNNNSVSQLSIALTRRTYMAGAFFIILLISITVNIVMVINNIGGLK